MQLLSDNFDKKIKQSIFRLRQAKHQAGHPFMIEGSGELAPNQAYMEYADGRIEIVVFEADYQDYHPIRLLTTIEARILRKKYLIENV